jgi:phospholipid-binding lipoprotein MlaA
MNSVKNISKFILALAAVGSLVSACSTSSQTGYMKDEGLSDPFENVNRKVFAFNEVVDDAVIHPILDGYRFAVPRQARTGIDNALRNLQSPVYMANDLLQGDVDGAGRTLFRAVVNTMVGFGGLMDVAGAEGYEGQSEDFGQTLAVWGVGHGPYIVFPILGPSSTRDYAGYFADSYMDPLRWYWFNTGEEHLYYTKAAANYLNLRNNLKDVLEDLQESSIDYYASVRSTYYQAREAVIEDDAKSAAAGAKQDVTEDAMMPQYPDYPDYDE